MPGTIPPITPTTSNAPTPTISSYTFGNQSHYNPSELGGYGTNGLYMTNISPYHVPLGVPMMPLYGYDNCEDSDKDLDYMRQMYPVTVRKMLAEIEEECDKLEYDGSCMFDEYPDRVYLGRIVDKIYAKCLYLNESSVSSESLTTLDETASVDLSRGSSPKKLKAREDYVDAKGRNWLRDMIEVLLYNEMLHRRRRYRSRKRWF
ncbi:MAG: hypothetical protein ACK5JH_14075 [Anaerocolumna sp.]